MQYLTFSFTNWVIVDAQFCSDLILVKESVDGCSKDSLIQKDPSEVLDGADSWFFKEPMQLLLVVAAMTVTGTFGFKLLMFSLRRG